MSKLKTYYPFLLLLLLPLLVERAKINPRAIIWSDTEGYFSYLPLVFTIGDVHKLPDGSVNGRKNAAGENVIKYTCGIAYFQMPAFFLTKAYMKYTGNANPDIFAHEFCYAVWITGFLVGVLGLFFLNKALQERGFSPGIPALTLGTVFFGTNLFHYMTLESGMSHAYSFGLFSFVLWFSPRFFKNPSTLGAMLLGLICPWIMLIRPTNVVFILFVVWANFYDDKKQFFPFFQKNILKIALALVAGFLVFVPQFLYWKEMTGQWLKFSYEGETFSHWIEPKITAVLLDPQNGLFLYSPAVVLMVVGMFLGKNNNKILGNGGGQILLFGLITYIFGSWWAWWFGGAFGHRSYVEFYAVFAFSLAFFLEKMSSVRLLWRVPFGILLVFLWYYGAKMSYLYQTLPRPWDGPEWRWNMEKMYWIWSHLF
jgi:hypothetical protein